MTTGENGRTRFRWWATIVLTGLLIGAGPARAAVSALANPNAGSPGGVGFPTIAQGVAEIATSEVAWRVVRDTAQPIGEAAALERALGFVFATDDALLVTDETSGERQRLAFPEAAFVPEGALQRHESLGDGATPYYRLALVPPADADYSAGGELVLAGAAFAAPGGPRDLDLIFGVLRPDQTGSLADFGFPIVMLALHGALRIETVAGDFTLAAGEAAAITDTLTIRSAGANEATFVAGIIGPEIPTGGAPPIETGGDGDDESGELAKIAVFVYDCPPGVTDQDVTAPWNASGCEIDFDATTATLAGDALAGGRLTLDELTSDEGDLAWFVPYGDYTLVVDNATAVVTNPEGLLGEPSGNTAVLYPFTLDANNRSVAIGIFLLE